MITYPKQNVYVTLYLSQWQLTFLLLGDISPEIVYLEKRANRESRKEKTRKILVSGWLSWESIHASSDNHLHTKVSCSPSMMKSCCWDEKKKFSAKDYVSQFLQYPTWVTWWIFWIQYGPKWCMPLLSLSYKRFLYNPPPSLFPYSLAEWRRFWGLIVEKGHK